MTNTKEKAKARSGGQGGSSTTDLQIEKSTVSLGIFLANFNILENIDFNVGVEISQLVNESFSGTTSGWTIDKPNHTHNNLNETHETFSSATCVGLKGRIAYDINLNSQWAISPQYSYYFGLTNEFEDFNAATRSMRHYFSIGLQRKLKSE